MELKSFIFLVAIIKYSSCVDGQLRKTPKVYNALITTDDNIQSSRAFPVIQPTIHETGIAHYPFSPYNRYNYFSPPLIHTVPPQEYHPPNSPIRLPPSEPGFPHFSPQLQYPHRQSEFPPLENPQDFGEFPLKDYEQHYLEQSGFPHQGLPPQFLQDRPTFLSQPQQPIRSPQENELNFVKKPNQNSLISKRPTAIKQGLQQKQDQSVLMPPIPTGQRQPPPQQPPIPLNQFGYPPSLIALQSFYHPLHPENHINLQPYPFNNYPILSDQINAYPSQFHNGNLLPPFSNYPNTIGVYQGTKKLKKKKPSTGTTATIPKATDSDIPADANNDAKMERNRNDDDDDESILPATPNTLGNFIKNGASNLNRDVPDVPPPPLPTSNVQN